MNTIVKNPEPKQHHKQPVFYLAGFCKPGTSDLFVYVIEKGEIHKSTPKKTAREPHFYSININGKLDTSLEKKIATIEDKAAPIIKNYIKNGTLTIDKRSIFGKFVALMFVRTRPFLDNLGKLVIAFEEADQFNKIQNSEYFKTMYKMSHPNASVEEIESIQNMLLSELTNPRNKSLSRDVVLQNSFLWWYLDYFTEEIKKMNWSLFQAPTGKSFITSDNPVCPHLPPEAVHKDVPLIEVFKYQPKLRLSFPLSSEFCWLGYYTNNEEKLYIADEKWLENFNTQRAQFAVQEIYASYNDNNIMRLAKEKAHIKPYAVSIPQTQAGFVVADTTVKRAHHN